jgi:ABC-type antimicrobial peptide transport system permease subunit
MLNDFRFAFRMLRKNPGFTAVAVLTLALGIGGTTAIFSVIYGAVLAPLPYADNHRLVVLFSQDVSKGAKNYLAPTSASEFLDYQEQNQVFDEVFANVAGRENSIVLSGSDGTEPLRGIRTSGNFFQVLGVPESIALAKVLQNRIWGIKSADPLKLVAVSLLLTFVGLTACYFPARQATKIDPMEALRYEQSRGR